MQHIYRITPMPKSELLCNFIEITLRLGCSPVNLLHIFRTLFSKNTSQWLLLDIGEKVIQRCRSFFFVIGTVAIFCKSYYYIRNNFIWQQRFHYIPTFLIITNVFFIKVPKLFSLTFSQNCSTQTFLFRIIIYILNILIWEYNLIANNNNQKLCIF